MAANIMTVTAGTLTLGTPPNDVSCQIISAVTRDVSDEVTIDTLCGRDASAGNLALRLDLEFLQDWSSTGISNYIANRRNQTVPFTWKPTAAATPSEAGSVKFTRRPAHGGQAGQPARDTLSIHIVGGTIMTVA